MSIEGPKVQYSLSELLDFQRDPGGRVIGATVNQSAAAFFTIVQQIVFGVSRSGPTISRPTAKLWVGQPYFDTTLNFSINWDGTQWVDTQGNPV